MATSRATTLDVLARVRAGITADAQQAAGNSQLSKSEEAALPAGVIKDAAAQMRQNGGGGTRIFVDHLVEAATGRVETLLGQVNQRSGSGKAVVSQAEVRAVAALDA